MTTANILGEMIVEISTFPAVDRPGVREDRETAAESEWKPALEPGMEIGFEYSGYLAIGLVLWVADLPDAVRAGVRLHVLSVPSECEGELNGNGLRGWLIQGPQFQAEARNDGCLAGVADGPRNQ